MKSIAFLIGFPIVSLINLAVQIILILLLWPLLVALIFYFRH